LSSYLISPFGSSSPPPPPPQQSSDCQKTHWASHKAICQHTQSQIASTKQPSAAYPDQDLAKQLRKFTSAHQSLLNWSGFQALQLKRVPANVRSHALLIELDFNAASSDPLRRLVVLLSSA
jgi:hypothetical protein